MLFRRNKQKPTSVWRLQPAKSLKENFTGLVENHYSFDGIASNISNGDKIFREDIQIGDSTMLKMYGFQLLLGNPQTTLNQPNTSEQAIKYLGKLDVIGKTTNR